MSRKKSQVELDNQDPSLCDSPTDSCRPALCALGTKPHRHCTCGLPMAAGAMLCDLCRSEGLHRDLSAVPASRTEWDGRTYPSLRLRRPADGPPDRYDAMLRAILGPLPVQNAKHSTVGEAA